MDLPAGRPSMLARARLLSFGMRRLAMLCVLWSGSCFLRGRLT